MNILTVLVVNMKGIQQVITLAVILFIISHLTDACNLYNFATGNGEEESRSLETE